LFDACLYYFFMVVVVVRYKTTATARWALLFIVRAFFNNTITVAVWTGFHVSLIGMLPQPHDYIRWCFADPAIAARPHDVRFTPESGHVRCSSLCLLWANSGHARQATPALGYNQLDPIVLTSFFSSVSTG
jgi:hypothetical protein